MKTKPNLLAIPIAALCLVAASMLSGCGGGGTQGSNSGNAPVAGPVQLGIVSAMIVGSAQSPVTSVGSGATITGLAGAQFTDITLSPGAIKDLSQTKILFAAYVNGRAQLFTMNPSGGNITQFTTTGGANGSWSADGSKIVYLKPDSFGINQVFTVGTAPGSTPQAMTSGSINKVRPIFTPDGTKIIYSAMDSHQVQQIYALSNGVSTQITTGSKSYYYYTVSPDGTQLAVCVGDSHGLNQINTMPITGGALTPITSGGNGAISPAWSPDGYKIAYVSTDANQTSGIFVVAATGGTGSEITVGSLQCFDPTWSPDGTIVTFSGIDSTNIVEIYQVFSSGGTPTHLTYGPVANYNPAWSPFLRPASQKLIGSGGSMGTSSAGFIVSQNGMALNSLVAFDTGAATTASRGSSRILVTSGTGSQSPTNLVFSITSGDTLSMLKYANGTGNNVFTAIGTGGSVTSATAAIVSFDARSGLVALVIPYTGGRAPSTAPVKNGINVTYQGSFPVVLDGNGKNLAPSGATSVTIDSTTGRLVQLIAAR